MAGAATTATALETRLFRLGTSSGAPEGQCRRCAFAPKQAISRICSVPSSRNLSGRCGETSAVRKQASTTQLLVSRVTGCAVKGGGPQRELNPPGNWFAPPGSNRSSGGGNEAAEAFGVEGRIGDSASMQAVT